LLLYGYRSNEGVTPKLGPTADDLSAVVYESPIRDQPVAVALDVVISGAVPPHPCQFDTATAVCGVAKRLGRALPKINRKTLKRFGSFVHMWLRKFLRPLALNQTMPFSVWVMSRPYSLARKRELIRKYLEVVSIEDRNKRYFTLKCFVKDEFYPEYKHARGIYSRKDEFKAYTGPWFSAIEAVLFQMPWFIKYVPVSQRAEHVRNVLERVGATYVYTDYTAFESSFVSEFMEVCEFQLYRYMVTGIPEGQLFYKVLCQALLGDQTLNFKEFTAWLKARRQSGEMCTSLGNGFTNLMIYLFACYEEGMFDTAVGFVEGDDGLFRCDHPERLEKYFSELGFSIKIGKTHDLSRASFCGMLYDTANGAVVTDVREALCTFGWVSAKYKNAKRKNLRALTRAKALSMAYSYPRCPMLTTFALKVLDLTSDCSDRDVYKWAQKTMNQYDLGRFLDAKRFGHSTSLDVTMSSRCLVEEEFGVSVRMQLAFEARVRSMTALGLIVAPELLVCVPRCWEVNWTKYTTQLPVYHRQPQIGSRALLSSIATENGKSVVRHCKRRLRDKWAASAA